MTNTYTNDPFDPRYLEDSQRRQAAGALVNAIDDDPEDAAKAVNLGSATGVNPVLIHSDLEGFEKQQRVAVNTKLSADNRFLQDYLTGHPMAAAVSHDDLAQLDEVSEHLGSFYKDTRLGQWLKSDSVAQSFITAAKATVTPPKEFLKGFGEEPIGQPSLQRIANTRPNDIEWAASSPLVAAAASVPAFAGELLSRTTAGVMSLGYENIAQVFGDKFAKEVMSYGEWGMMRGDIGVRAGGGGARTGFALNEELASQIRKASEAIKTSDIYTAEGKEPPANINPLLDEAHKIQAKEDGDALKELTRSAQASQTRERSPEMFAKFIESHIGNREIGIDADAIRRLYGDKVPAPDDGILGWVPGLAERLTSSVGDDVRVPLKDWLAKVDPEVAKELHDDVRVRDGGLTINDTKVGSEKEGVVEGQLHPEPVAKEIIPEPLQTVRGAAGLEPMFQVGDRKLTIGKKPPRIDGKTGAIAADEFDVLDEIGKKVGWLEMTPHDGGKKVYVDNVMGLTMAGMGPNKFGPGLTRSLIQQIKQAYPQVEQIGGFRISGAREKAGTERDVWIKVQPGEEPIDLKTHEDFKQLLTQNWEEIHKGLFGLFHEEGKGVAADSLAGQMVMHELARIVPDAEADVAHGLQAQNFGELHGAYVPNFRQILVSLRAIDPIGTARHEAIHALKDLGLFSDKEWDTLQKASADLDWVKKYNIEERWAGGKGVKLTEESIAEAYLNWARGNDMPKEVHTLFERFKQFLEGLRTQIKELFGHDLSWEEIFQKVDSGEIGRRELPEVEGAEGEITAQPDNPANDNKTSAQRLRERKDYLIGEMDKLNETAGRRGWTEFESQRFGQLQKELLELRKPKDEEPKFQPADDGLYDRGKALGVTQAHMERMQKLIDKKNSEDLETAQRRAEVRQRRRSNKEWKERRTQLRDEVRESIEQRPDIAIDQMMTTDKIKIDPKYLTEEQRSRLPKDYVQKKNGVDPDDLAGYFGYTTGDALVERLTMLTEDRVRSGMSTRDYLNRLIDIETDRRLNQEFGNREQSILDEAKDQALSETALNLVHEETLAYALKAGQEPQFTKDEVRDMVKADFDSRIVGSISSDILMSKAGTIGKKIEEAGAKGDWAEAYRLSQQRNHTVIAAKLARAYEKSRAQFDRTAKTFSKNRTIASVDQEYVNWIQDILLRTGHSLARSVQDLAENIGRQSETNLAAFIDAKEAHFMGMRQLDVPDFLRDPDFRTPVDELSVHDFEGLKQGIKILEKAGRDEKSINVRGENWDLAKTKHEMVEKLATFGYDRSKMEANTKFSLLRKMAYGLTNMETLLNRWDRGDPRGVFNKVIVHPLVEAANGKSKLLREIARDLDKIERPSRGELGKLVEAPFADPSTPGGQGEWTGFNRGNVLMMLQNAGNKSNWTVLSKGYGADPEALFKWLQKNVTKDDVLRAQQMGDIFKKLIAQSNKVYERLTGATVEKVPLKPIEFTLADGEKVSVPGWYHPLDRDSIRASMWKEDAETGERERVGARGRESAYGDADYFHASTSNGYTKKRTGAVYPLNLDFNFIPTRLRQIAHDIHFREPLLSTEKIFADRLFQEDVAKYYGREYAKGLMPYLRSLAGSEGIRSENHVWAESFLEKARQNIISTYIGFNPFTVFKHGPTAAWLSSNEVGAVPFAKAFAELAKPGSAATRKFIMDSSEELQRRERHWQDTLGGQGNELSDKSTFREQMIDWGSKAVAKSDMASAMPTWWAAYQQFLEQGESHGSAITLADRAVRRAHGSTAETNLPPLVRGGGVLNRYMTSVYGFFGTVMQRRIEMAHQMNDIYQLGREGELKAAARNMPKLLNDFMAYVVWPTIIEEAVTGMTTEDRHGWGMHILSGATMGLSSSVLYLRDLMYGLTTGHDPGAGLVSSAMHDAANFARDVRRGPGAFSKEHAGKTIEDTLTLFGEVTGKMPKTVARGIRFGIDVFTGQQKPKTPVEWMRGITHGEAQRRKH